jgi:8-oxo-dGTP pyrophosphatase MutT (NUDIX family)
MTERILSAGVVVLRRVDQGWRVLLLRVYNYWDFPKGLVEAGEEALATARREVREETGIEDLEFRWGEIHTDTAPYSRNKVARYFLAVTVSEQVVLPINPEIGKPEHHEWRWLSFDDALTLVPDRLVPVLNWAERIV